MKTIVIALLSLFATHAMAANKVGSISECGIQLLVLNSWTPVSPEKLKSPVCFEMAVQRDASLSVLKSSDGKQTCAEFLKGMDESRKRTNLLKPEKQKMTEGQLKLADASDGALGEYEISGPPLKVPVKQKSYCFKKGNEIRVILGTFQKNKGASYEPLITEIVTTFKFTK